MELLANTTDKARELRRMKRWCLALLLSCVAASLLLEWLFPASSNLFIVFAKGLFEAAVVGAMADWYAVVALFSHPLGISALPHTAIIAKKKNDIGENLGKFVRDEFMQDEVVTQKITEFQPIDRLFNWIEKREKKYFISNFLRKMVLALLADKSADYINEFARKNIHKFVESTDAANVLGKIILIFDNDDYRNELVNIILDKVLVYVADEKDGWIARAKSEGVWGTKWIGGKYIEGFIEAIFQKMQEVRADDSHPMKAEVKSMLGRFADRLHNDPATIAAVNQFKNEFMDSPKFLEFVNTMVAHLKTELINDLHAKKSYLVEHVHQGVMALVKKYREDAEFNEYLNNLLSKLVNWFLEHKDKIAQYLADQVKAWSPELVSQKLELEIGKDLQWIRVSGTVVGGIVGGVFATVLFLIR